MLIDEKLKLYIEQHQLFQNLIFIKLNHIYSYN